MQRYDARSHKLQVRPDAPSYPTDAMHVYVTNEYCSVWNNSHFELQVGPDMPSYPADAMHVYMTNEYCSVWNNSNLELIQGRLHTSHAFDISKDQHT